MKNPALLWLVAIGGPVMLVFVPQLIAMHRLKKNHSLPKSLGAARIALQERMMAAGLVPMGRELDLRKLQVDHLLGEGVRPTVRRRNQLRLQAVWSYESGRLMMPAIYSFQPTLVLALAHGLAVIILGSEDSVPEGINLAQVGAWSGTTLLMFSLLAGYVVIRAYLNLVTVLEEVAAGMAAAEGEEG